jgi:hypothetical protein
MRTTVHFLSAFLLSGLISLSQETDTVPTVKETGVGDAWLGLGVSKPDDVTAIHLPALPPGIGFIVSELAEGGPAEKAGVRKNDLLWKMGEQMLVNEGQFATLLRLAAPGEEITLSLFREGKALDLKVTLGEGKGDEGAAIRRRLVDSVIRSNDEAIRIVDLDQRKAVVTDERGAAEVTRLSEGDAVRIVDTQGKVIFDGLVRGCPELSAVPHDWRRQVSAMRRGLDHALSATPAPMRQPRPRIVPPQTEPAPATVGK